MMCIGDIKDNQGYWVKKSEYEKNIYHYNGVCAVGIGKGSE